MNRLSYSAWAILTLLLISGCGRDPIETVKNGYLSIDESLTVGDAYGGYKPFKDQHWTTFRDNQNREIVKFSATIDPYMFDEIIRGIDTIRKISYSTQFKINNDGSFEVYGSQCVIERSGGEVANIDDSYMEFVVSIYKNQVPTALREEIKRLNFSALPPAPDPS